MANIEEEIEEMILKQVDALGEIESSRDFAESIGVEHDTVVGVMKSLETSFFIEDVKSETQLWEVTEEGKIIIENGSPEFMVFKAMPEEGIAMSDLAKYLEGKIGSKAAAVGKGHAMKHKWINRDKETGLVKPCNASDVVDSVQVTLKSLMNEGGSVVMLPVKSKEATVLKKRKLIKLTKFNSYKLIKGPKFQLQRSKVHATLTKEMIESGSWKDAEFKMNYNTLGKPVCGGYLHPLLKVRTEFRKILLSMGFSEMPTNQFVESSFWNFDALFQPQSHPARDAHDTFFISEPAEALQLPEEYVERVKNMHESGGFGSLGYNYKWKRSEALKNMLRTHTTATSSQMLYQLANQPGGFKPAKYFSIDRVFRNETVDATHLAEFHQVELLVADRNLTLGNLIGMIYSFFESIGITQLRFKPAYNPYTEPSMEIFGYHPDLKKWTEIGNSGIFRPEMLRPMGLPEDVQVIACGLSVERPTMIKYRIKKIKELFGHKCDINRTRSAPIARFP